MDKMFANVFRGAGKFGIEKIREAYRIFGERLDGAIKVAIKP